MLHHSIRYLALAALLAGISASPAAAGSCCACAGGCAPAVLVTPPLFTAPFLIVDQGPVYSGPGIVVVPGYVAVNTMPATYPYVGRDYAYPPYVYYRGWRHYRRGWSHW